LKLCKCKIDENFPFEIFAKLQKLEELDLSENNIVNVKNLQKLIENAKNLKTLILNHNPLESIIFENEKNSYIQTSIENL